MSMNTTDQRLKGQSSQITVDWLIAIITMLAIFIGALYSATISETNSLLFASLGFLLIFALVVSTISDLVHRKIYNCVTYPIFMFAIGLNATASFHSTTVACDFVGLFNGTVGIASSVGGAFCCFLVVFAAYLKSGCGAGDVKIAATIGAILGVRFGVWAVMYSYLAAFVFFVIPITLWRFLKDKTANKSEQAMLPMAPFFAIGTLYVVLEVGL